MMFRISSVASGILWLGLAAGTAQAEIGKASAGPGEWFMGFNVGAGAAWGTEHEAYLGGLQSFPTRPSHAVNFDEGMFFSGGGEIGYRLQQRSWIDRIELNVDLGMLSRNISHDTDHAFFALNDGKGNRSAFGFFNQPEMRAQGDDDTAGIEARLSFKSMLLEDEDHAVLVSFEPFFRYQDTDSLTEAVRPDRVLGGRSDSIEAEYYGLQLGLEMERPLSESLSLVGRASAGAYYVDSDIESSAEYLGRPQGAPITASDSNWGGRFGGALGVKVPLYYAGASLTIIGTVDYMTDVATIDHIPFPTPLPVAVTKAAFDDQLELGGKVGLVFPLK